VASVYQAETTRTAVRWSASKSDALVVATTTSNTVRTAQQDCVFVVGTSPLTQSLLPLVPGRACAVLAVMLHELCHNEFGPHSASFYKLLDEITEECKQLQAKKQGGSGAGFDAQGQKLGHRGGWGVAPSDPKIAARDAAMKRAQAHAVMTGGGRVGGAVAPGLTPQQAAAAAALRRAKAEEFARANRLEDDAIGTLGDEPLRFGRPGCICGACSTDAQAGQCGAPAPGGAPKHRGVGTAEEPIVLD